MQRAKRIFGPVYERLDKLPDIAAGQRAAGEEYVTKGWFQPK
jgi:hypothetical protein